MVVSLQSNRVLKVGDGAGDLIFKQLYNLLYSLIKFQREQIIHLIPIFTNCINTLLNTLHQPAKHKLKTNGGIAMLKSNLNYAECGRLFTRLVQEMLQKPRGESEALVKPFLKHSPYLLTNLILKPTLKTTIGTSWNLVGFMLLDCCDEYGRRMVLRNVRGQEESYKEMVGDWEKNFRYKGKA